MAREHARLVRAIVERICAEPGCWAFRAPVASGLREGRWVSGGYAGCADVLATCRGRAVAIEAKIGRDRLRPTQVLFRLRWEAGGGTYLLARSVDDVDLLLTAMRE